MPLLFGKVSAGTMCTSVSTQKTSVLHLIYWPAVRHVITKINACHRRAGTAASLYGNGRHGDQAHVQYAIRKRFILNDTCLRQIVPYLQCGTSWGELNTFEMILNLPMLPHNDYSKWEKKFNTNSFTRDHYSIRTKPLLNQLHGMHHWVNRSKWDQEWNKQ